MATPTSHQPLTSPNKRTLSRQQWLLLFLGLVAGGSLYLNVFVKSLWKESGSLRKQKAEAGRQLDEVKAQMPNLSTTQVELELLKERIEAAQQANRGTEAKLLSEKQLPDFLTQLIKCGQGLNIDFQSVKQEIQADKASFSRLWVDMKFVANHEDIVNYLNRIEHISPFIRLETLLLTPQKEAPDEKILTGLKISALLASQEASGASLLGACENVPAVQSLVAKNPFAPDIKKVVIKKRDLKLLGITFRGRGKVSSALINDTMVKEGDEIQGQRVEKIQSDYVLLNDGTEKYRLNVER